MINSNLTLKLSYKVSRIEKKWLKIKGWLYELLKLLKDSRMKRGAQYTNENFS